MHARDGRACHEHRPDPDCGVDAKTVREYYQILCDTLRGELTRLWAGEIIA